MGSINELLNMEFLKNANLQCPDKIAIKDTEKQYSYKELDEKSTKLSSQLVKYGVLKGDCIGIFMENNVDYIVCILAIMQIAAIFVPIAPQYPIERLREIVKNCMPKIILTNNNNEEKINDVSKLNHLNILNLNKIDFTCNTNRFYIKLMPKQVGYIIYTSGSTGQPKGVAICWESLNNYIQDTNKRLCFDETLISLNMTPFYFDGALTGIFCVLLCKGTLVIENAQIMRPGRFINLLKNEKITDLGCTPMQLKMLAESLIKEPDNKYFLKTIAIGGESFSANYVQQIMNCIPEIKILNRYGPTETTIVVSSYQITRADTCKKEPFPIGKPIDNVFFYAINEEGEKIKTKEIGELYIGGIQIMVGYWNDPLLTSNVINEDILPGTKLYRSGDLVTIDENGNYIFVGRADDMIKKNGYRIYLLEVENALAKIEYISCACCIAIKNNNTTDIVAFVTIRDNIKEIDKMEYIIKHKLSEFIPVNMLPQKILCLKKFPLTSTGKIDRTSLNKIFYNL